MKTKRANVRKAYDDGCPDVKRVIKTIWPDIDQPELVKRKPVKGEVWIDKTGIAVLVTEDAGETMFQGVLIAGRTRTMSTGYISDTWNIEAFRKVPDGYYLANDVPGDLIDQLFGS